MTSVVASKWRYGIVTVALLAAACGDKKADDSAAGNTAAPLDPVSGGPATPPPAGQDWTETVSATPDGGYLMGNPDAKVKLVEYLSLTCPHCAEFSAVGGAALKASYVRNGQVSWEVRNFVRDPVDYSAALLARCGEPTAAFKLTEQMLADQQGILGRFQTMDKATSDRIGKLPAAQQFAAIAEFGELDQFVKLRGITESKAKACLLDEAAQKKLLDMRDVATKQFGLEGTPTFLINGTKVEGAAWEAIEPQIRSAL